MTTTDDQTPAQLPPGTWVQQRITAMTAVDLGVVVEPTTAQETLRAAQDSDPTRTILVHWNFAPDEAEWHSLDELIVVGADSPRFSRRPRT